MYLWYGNEKDLGPSGSFFLKAQIPIEHLEKPL